MQWPVFMQSGPNFDSYAGYRVEARKSNYDSSADSCHDSPPMQSGPTFERYTEYLVEAQKSNYDSSADSCHDSPACSPGPPLSAMRSTWLRRARPRG
jgi:hypothetical protein